MPYIENSKRKRYDSEIGQLVRKLEDQPQGHLTYVLYALVARLIAKSGLSYSKISSAIAAVTDTEHELRNRVLSVYEKEKRESNGDIL